MQSILILLTKIQWKNINSFKSHFLAVFIPTILSFNVAVDKWTFKYEILYQSKLFSFYMLFIIKSAHVINFKTFDFNNTLSGKKKSGFILVGENFGRGKI